MSKTISTNYLKEIGMIQLDPNICIAHNNDKCELSIVNGPVIDSTIFEEDKFISVKLDGRSSEVMMIRFPLNNAIKEFWLYRFYQKHRLKSKYDFDTRVYESKLNDNKDRMDYTILEKDQYNICVKIDKKYDIMIPVAFNVDLRDDIDLDELRDDLMSLFYTYTPRGSEILY